MHATSKKSDNKERGFKFTVNVKERGIHVQTIIMMTARSHRIGDKRRKLMARDERRIG